MPENPKFTLTKGEHTITTSSRGDRNDLLARGYTEAPQKRARKAAQKPETKAEEPAKSGRSSDGKFTKKTAEK